MLERGGMARRRGYGSKLESIQRASLVAHWPLNEASGTTVYDASPYGRTGTYTSVTLGQTGIGDGRTAPLFDGTSGFANIFSASLASGFNGQEITVAGWARVLNAGVWTDGTQDRALILQSDATNRYIFQRPTTSSQFQFVTNSGGTAKTITKTAMSTAAWFHFALTSSKVADQLIGYINGVAVAAATTGLGTYAGALTSAVIGATDAVVPANYWNGWLAHIAIWSAPLTAAEIARLASVTGY